MMWKIGVCVICASPVCAECDSGEAVHYSCPTHREVAVIEGWAQVYTTSDDVEAGLLRDNLQSEGIDAAVRTADVVVTMGCGDACPFFPGKRYEDWVLDDPAGQDLVTVRGVRDEIRRRVETLISELTA